jgi:hypothetical protein
VLHLSLDCKISAHDEKVLARAFRLDRRVKVVGSCPKLGRNQSQEATSQPCRSRVLCKRGSSTRTASRAENRCATNKRPGDYQGHCPVQPPNPAGRPIIQPNSITFHQGPRSTPLSLLFEVRASATARPHTKLDLAGYWTRHGD